MLRLVCSSNRHFISGIGVCVVFAFILLFTDIYELNVISSIATITYIWSNTSNITNNQPITSSKGIKQCLNKTLYTYNMQSLRHVDLDNNKTRILITGITTCNGYYLSKYFMNNMNLSSQQIIGMNHFRKHSHFQSQIIREQQLIRMGINVLHGDLCDDKLLTEIIDITNISVVINAADYCHNTIYNIEINRPALITKST
eukprot:33980_1